MAFNPREHLIFIGKGNDRKEYLPVQYRLVWANEVCPEITIEIVEKIIDLDRETEEEAFVWNSETRRSEKTVKRARGWAYFEMRVTVRFQDGSIKSAIGVKSEKAASFPDYIEKAQTGAIGRALAMLGFGTQYTADEFNEQHRIVDASVERRQPEQDGQRRQPAARTEQKAPATKEEKWALACKMAEKLGMRQPPESMDEEALDDLIDAYKRENAAKKRSEQQEAAARAKLEQEKAGIQK